MYDRERMDQFTDKRGKTVRRGDEVAYVYNQMTLAVMGVGRVEDITLHKGPNPWQQGLRIKIRSNANVNAVDEVRNGFNIVKIG